MKNLQCEAQLNKSTIIVRKCESSDFKKTIGFTKTTSAKINNSIPENKPLKNNERQIKGNDEENYYNIYNSFNVLLIVTSLAITIPLISQIISNY